MMREKFTRILNRKLLVLIVIALFVNLPVVNALEISGISAEDIKLRR